MPIPVNTVKKLMRMLLSQRSFILFPVQTTLICMIKRIKSPLTSWKAFLKKQCKQEDKYRSKAVNKDFRFTAFYHMILLIIREHIFEALQKYIGCLREYLIFFPYDHPMSIQGRGTGTEAKTGPLSIDKFIIT